MQWPFTASRRTLSLLFEASAHSHLCRQVKAGRATPHSLIHPALIGHIVRPESGHHDASRHSLSVSFTTSGDLRRVRVSFLLFSHLHTCARYPERRTCSIHTHAMQRDGPAGGVWPMRKDPRAYSLIDNSIYDVIAIKLYLTCAYPPS